MDNAWDLKDQGGSGGISIPTDDFQGGTNGASGDAPRRSRSRSPGRGRRGGGEEEAENPGNNLHVSGLHYKVDTRELESIFVKVGRVQKASVVTDPHTRESRLFGFVTMESREEADAAITALNGTELMGKVITVTRARRGRARTPTPGKYHGPGKRRGDRERPYEPRPYDGRYDGRSADYDDRRRGGGRYDDRDRDRDRDRRPSRRDDRDRDYGRGDRYERYDRYDRYDDRDRERDRDSRDRRY